MHSLGIDPSLSSTGLVMLKWEGSKAKVVWSELIICKPSSKLTGWKRLKHLTVQLIKLKPALQQVEPDICAIEGVALGSPNPRVIADISEWIGILKLFMGQISRELKVVPPTTMKKHITGNGRATKQQVAHHIYQQHKIKFAVDDLSDAAGVALWGINMKEQ